MDFVYYTKTASGKQLYFRNNKRCCFSSGVLYAERGEEGKTGGKTTKSKDTSENYHGLMDVQMPEMDGRTAAREIRKLSRPDARTIPIFALSADAFVEDERLSLESGMNGHFAKPVDFAALERSVGAFLKMRGGK